MRIDTEAACAGALIDAKAMLFVDDHETKPGKTHVVGQQSLGADNEVDFSRLNRLERGAAFPLGQCSGEEKTADTAAGEVTFEGMVVLAGAAFGGAPEDGRMCVWAAALE